MSAYSSEMTHLKQVISTLQQNLSLLSHKTSAQKQLCTEYIHVFEKFSKGLSGLAEKIQNHANKLQGIHYVKEGKNSESVVLIFQCLSSILMKISQESKSIAVKGKNQILDPLRLFTDNCMSLNKNFLGKLKSKQLELNQKYAELFRNKQSYIASSERLQKNRKTQSKLMEKIENGDISELEKFNNNIRKMTQSIKNTEDQYANSVKKINKSLDQLREQLKEISTSITYNEESRVAFTKKTLLYSIKNIKQFFPESWAQLDRKLEAELQNIQNINNETILNTNLAVKIANITLRQQKQQVESYAEMQKRKRKKILEEQNSHLYQIFSKVKEQDKHTIKYIVKSWFKKQGGEKGPQQTKEENEKQRDGDWEKCREKIISVLPYSYYFIQSIYEQITEMGSIYSKQEDENFLLLLQLFCEIMKNLKIKQGSSTSAISIEFAYRMIHISIRVMWKKKNVSLNQPIELLCQYFGKKSNELHSEEIYYKLYSYLQKKKVLKKTPVNNTQTAKGMMDSFMKGMQEAMNFKKQQKLTEQQSFGCLNQLTYMMANLLTPNEVAIPVIKKLLGKNQNSKSFEYLKSILFEKKDQQERQKIFFRTEVKGKMEAQIEKVMQNKKVAQYCLKLSAKLGFFGKSQISLRLICRDLQYVHREILYNLQIPIKIKWFHMIPFDKKLNYQQLVEEVEKKGIPSQSEQIIIMDVNRSLHNHTQILAQETLRRLLRVTAFNNPEIGYCQGMNYIAGYLYLKAGGDEQKSFRLLQYLMDSRFKQLFANEFQVLKVKLYQFERLLAIFHPDLSGHFKRQGIPAECYIVAWIITVFASSYQYTQQSYLIDLLWQRFIVWGWREFFKFVLALFNVYKQELIELTYDKAMHFLGNIARSDILKCNKEEYLLKYAKHCLQKNIESYEISPQLLQNLEKQYNLK